MTNDRDPTLQTLFSIAGRDLPEEAFSAQVMSKIDRQRRRTAFGWSAVYLLLVPCVLFLVFLLHDAAEVAAQILPTALIEVDENRFSQIFAPVNSIPGVVVIGLITLRAAYNKIFS